MIQDNEKVSDGDDGSLDVGDRQWNDFGDLFPGGIDILAFVDIELAAVRTKSIPNFVLKGNLNFRVQELVGLAECVNVASGTAVDKPRDSLQAYPHIDDLHW